MTRADVDHITTIKINKFYLKVALGAPTGQLDTKEATSRIA
jgi:hypothetical protein